MNLSIRFAIVWTCIVAAGCSTKDPLPPVAPPVPGAIFLNVSPSSSTAHWVLRGPSNFQVTGSGAQEFQDMPLGEYSISWEAISGTVGGVPMTQRQNLQSGGTIEFRASYERWVLLSPDLGPFSNPVWSPDGTQFAYASGGGSASDIWIYNLQDETANPFIITQGFDGQPDWSPDGKSLAYASDANGPRSVFVRSIGSSSSQLLVLDAAEPAWAPSGQSLAFIRDSDLFLWAPGGSFPSNPYQLTFDEAAKIEGSPDWAPDGMAVAFIQSYYTGSNPTFLHFDISLIAPDYPGSFTVRHAFSGINIVQATAPRWSPNARFLAFTYQIDFPDDYIRIANCCNSLYTDLSVRAGFQSVASHVAWHPEGRVILLEADRGALGSGVWLVAVDDKLPG